MTPAPADLQPRARRRLELARDLLAASPARFGVTAAQVQRTTEPSAVLSFADGLSERARDDLKALVDWVEDYERAEA